MSKVALCLHGYFDSKMDSTSKGIDGYEYIKREILDKADVDVYIHSWQPELEDEIRELYKPKKAIFEKQMDFSPIVKELGLDHLPGDSALGRSPATVLSHFNSVSKVFLLVDDDIYDYEWVIKARFDLGRINRNTSGPDKHNPFPVQCIDFDMYNDPELLHMANWDYFDSDGPPDMWFYSEPSIMSKFKYLYYYAVNKMKEPNAVRLYKAWMKNEGIWNLRNLIDPVWK